MRTFKPFCLSVLPRAVDMGDRYYLSLNVFAAFDVANSPRLLLEQSLWRFLPQAAPGFTEAGMPKPRSEYLVFGHAYLHAHPDSTPPGAVPGRSHAGMRFGGLEKALVVWGERQWDGRVVTAPAPFERVPLGWPLAFGGPGFADNPAGRGLVAGKAQAMPLALPQFEHADHPWHPDPTRNRAVGFAPLEIDNPQRTRYQGTYDDAWLKQRSPGMPSDFDWLFYQVAPSDQWFERPLAGDEPYEWHHLHPRMAIVQGRLPGICPRAFIRRVGADILEPVPTTLRTVLFFPEHDKLVLIWQGVAHTSDEEMGDLSHLLVGAERLGAPRDPAHYEQVFRHRDDRAAGMLAVLREGDLLPDGLDFEPLVSLGDLLRDEPPPSSFAARSRERAQAVMQAARAEVASYGLNPDVHAPPAELPKRPLPTDVKDLPAFFAELQRESEAQVAKARNDVENSLSTTERQLAGFGYDGRIVRAEIATPPSGPPQAEAGPRIEALKALASFAAGSGVEIGEVDAMSRDAALHAQWHEGDRHALRRYVQTAHHQQPATRSEQRHAARQQQWVRERLLAGQPLAGLDLTGADLRAFDLRGANLDNALLESAQLDGAQLDRATLKGAVLAHARLQRASLRGCDLTRCNLGKADLRLIEAEAAVFDHAVCQEADFSNAQLLRASFKQAQLVGVVFAAARLDGACLDETLLNETRLEGASLVGTSTRRAVFMKTPLVGADLRQLQGPRVVFYGVQVERLRLDGATLEGASFVEGTSMRSCSLRGSDLRRAFARGADFSGCDLSGARLDGAMLAHADLGGATLRSASGVGMVLMHARLDRADLSDMNLRDALLSAASARGTDLREANLFGADLTRFEMDSATRPEGALTQRARLYPRARATPAAPS